MRPQACAQLDQLGRDVLRRMCRSPQLQLHPAALDLLLEDAPPLRGQPSASVLRCSRYDGGGLGGGSLLGA